MTRHDPVTETAVKEIPDRVKNPESAELTYSALEFGDEIGRGGNARVRMAESDRYNTPLAIKEPLISGGQQIAESFESEAATWSNIDSHQHILTVIDWGIEPEPWIALEYAEGGSLSTLVGSCPLDQAVWSSIKIAEAIRYAHRHGVVHFDLKPENVLLTQYSNDTWPVPKVTDWGLSELLLTHSGFAKGLTFPYAAPEQFADDGKSDDFTDIYQLGALIYALCTGHPLASGNRSEIADTILNGDVRSPSSVDTRIPNELERIIEKAMANTKQERYEDVLLLIEDLWDVFQDITSVTSLSQPRADSHRTGSLRATRLQRGGSREWATDLGTTPAGAPVITEEMLYVTTTDGKLVALSAHGGGKQETIEIDARLRSGPIRLQNTLYAPDSQGSLLSFEIDSLKQGKTIDIGDKLNQPPVVDRDHLYFPTANGTVACYTRSGNFQWEIDIPGRLGALPAVSRQHLFCPSFDAMSAIDRSNGRLSWERSDLAPYRIEPLINGQTVVTAGNQTVAAHTIDTGEKLWTHEIEAQTTGLAVTDDVLVVTTDGAHVYGLDITTGTRRWESFIRGRALTAPYVTTKSAYVGCYHESATRTLPERMDDVYCLSVDSGDTQWSYSTDSELSTAPVPAGSRLYILTEAGIVEALG